MTTKVFIPSVEGGKTIQELVRHASSITTQDIYQQRVAGDEDEFPGSPVGDVWGPKAKGSPLRPPLALRDVSCLAQFEPRTVVVKSEGPWNCRLSEPHQTFVHTAAE